MTNPHFCCCYFEFCEKDRKVDHIICEMLCTCGLFHCKASHFCRHLRCNSNRERIVKQVLFS
ncbi:CLUMA_CG012455, isoform A [Clunio marinus]|uniref:CLUMA_CG012455, isoform A n=1 Tax=Clunio marinus TaxID=568069 RepID=A0A1J1IKY9_9DIPT|nr:CLUMA_CG012455, isoform A [Clunio marinus]